VALIRCELRNNNHEHVEVSTMAIIWHEQAHAERIFEYTLAHWSKTYGYIERPLFFDNHFIGGGNSSKKAQFAAAGLWPHYQNTPMATCLADCPARRR
jgi:hypothetical protein